MIGPGNEVLSEELDRYFQRQFGRPETVREVRVFGQGIGHAFGEDDCFRPRLVGGDGGMPPVAPLRQRSKPLNDGDVLGVRAAAPALQFRAQTTSGHGIRHGVRRPASGGLKLPGFSGWPPGDPRPIAC